MVIVTHLRRSLESIRAERWIDASDYRDCPPKLCGSGSYHAKWTDDRAKVDCPACLAKL
jgi:hypothetical protein